MTPEDRQRLIATIKACDTGPPQSASPPSREKGSTTSDSIWQKEINRKGWGVIVFVIGIIAAGYFFLFFDTSVAFPRGEILGQAFGGGRVNNIGLIKDQQNGIIVSLAVAAIGAIMMLVPRRSSGADMQCPYCAETIKAQVKACRFCGKELD